MARVRVLRSVSIGLVLILSTLGQANWSETFNDGAFDLSTWLFRAYPELAGTFDASIAAGEDGNGYLVLSETTALSQGGLGAGHGHGVDGAVRRRAGRCRGQRRR